LIAFLFSDSVYRVRSIRKWGKGIRRPADYGIGDSVVSFPSGVWDKVLAENEFGAFHLFYTESEKNELPHCRIIL